VTFSLAYSPTVGRNTLAFIVAATRAVIDESRQSLELRPKANATVTYCHSSVMGRCAQTIHAIRILTSQGLCNEAK